jgi:hypothetical protein
MGMSVGFPPMGHGSRLVFGKVLLGLTHPLSQARINN